MCRRAGWHRIEECEDTDELEARQFKRLKSDLFNSRECELPSVQKESMIRNSNVPFLRLPPEIRLRIYAFVLGARDLWIGHKPEQHKWNYVGKTIEKPFFSTKKEKFHCGGSFYFPQNVECEDQTLDLRLLQICRKIYTETALLPYRLNTFIFQDDAVRKRFEKSARAGKKRAQKQAVGKYEIMDWGDSQLEEWKRQGLA